MRMTLHYQNGIRLAGFMALMVTSYLAHAQSAVYTGTLRKVPFKAHLHDASLTEMLRLLSTQAHVSVVVDGYPVRTKGTLDIEGDVGSALDAIADAFDYEWTATKAGVVTMTKRFKSKGERPQAYLKEMQRTGRDILDALRLTAVKPDRNEAFDILSSVQQSLSVSQWDNLRGGAKLRISDLTLAQQKLLRTAIYDVQYAETIKVWQRFSELLDCLKTGSFRARIPSAGTQPTQSDPFFLYRKPDGQRDILILIPYNTN